MSLLPRLADSWQKGTLLLDLALVSALPKPIDPLNLSASTH